MLFLMSGKKLVINLYSEFDVARSQRMKYFLVNH